MKKILLLGFLLYIFTTNCFAAKLAYEPETPTSASFSASDQYYDQYITFVNYAKSDGSNEYWVRFALLVDKDKVLYNASLNIDGVVYELQPVYEPSYKYEYAAHSSIDNNMYINAAGLTSFRYYIIPQEAVEKLKTAKKVIFLYNHMYKSNEKVTLYNSYLTKVKSILDLKYTDLPTYFHPDSK